MPPSPSSDVKVPNNVSWPCGGQFGLKMGKGYPTPRLPVNGQWRPRIVSFVVSSFCPGEDDLVVTRGDVHSRENPN